MNNDLNEEELTEEEMLAEEKRFMNMLDGVGEEYDDLIREQEAEQDRKNTRRAIIMGIMLVVGIAIVAWASLGFYEPWITP